MRLSIYFTPPQHPEAGSASSTPILVIDILRATTTIVTALANGARAVIPVATTGEALAAARTLEHQDVLLAGERGSMRIPGFALGNSPLEMTPDAVAGKTLVMTTTNGTRAIAAAWGRPVIIAAAVNFRAAVAAARWAFEAAGELVILCAGREGGFSLEDAYAAGRFAEAIAPSRRRRAVVFNDAVLAARELVRRYRGDWAKAVSAGAHARFLAETGFEQDIAAAAAADQYDVVPVYVERRITVDQQR